MDSGQITQWAYEVGIELQTLTGISGRKRTLTCGSTTIEELQAFAALVRNDALDLAKEVCRQVVRDTNSTLTWEGCNEIQEALEKEKA